jgi:hypothetical protein
MPGCRESAAEHGGGTIPSVVIVLLLVMVRLVLNRIGSRPVMIVVTVIIPGRTRSAAPGMNTRRRSAWLPHSS